ncbi:hypothetical protein EDD15DRAFT_2196894 [Pisolithus albus]|nr:hypothetical protein EDD15DRAFT_2196894 [Pisolithus albus]
MDPVCGISLAQIGLFPGPMGLSPGQSWVVSGFPQAKYITFKGILGHSPGSRGILQEVFASGGGITKEDGMGSLRASLMVVRVNAGYRSFPELRDHDRKSPQSLQDRHLEIQHWQEMGLEILTVGDSPGWSNGVGDSPGGQLEIPQGVQMGLGILQGGSWRFPRVVKWGWRFSREAAGDSPGSSWRFPRGQLEIPQGGQMGLEILQDGSWRFPRMVKWGWGFSRRGSWRFPRVVKWGRGFSRETAGDSPGWSLEIPQRAVGDFPGGSWRFPRGQLEIPQGAVGDSPGGSWRFPRGQLEIPQGAVGDFPWWPNGLEILQGGQKRSEALHWVPYWSM